MSAGIIFASISPTEVSDRKEDRDRYLRVMSEKIWMLADGGDIQILDVLRKEIAFLNRIVELKAEIASREAFVDGLKREHPENKFERSHFLMLHRRDMTDLKYTIVGLEVALENLQKVAKM
jgi:hypothetical protein